MIPVIEDYLSELVDRKIQFLKSKPDLIKKILRVSDGRASRLMRYLENPENKIRVVKGYPRPDAVLPCYAVLLANEEETQDGLGDYDETDEYSVSEHEEQVVAQVGHKGGQSSLPYIQLSNIPLSEITQLIHVPTGTEIFPINYNIIDYDRGIVQINHEDVEEGDPFNVVYEAMDTAEENVASLFTATFRIESWSTNSELTGEMYHLVKWCLLSGRNELLTTKGIIRQKLSGGDLQPSPNYTPAFVYRRGLDFWCQYEATSFVEDVGYINGVEAHMEVYSQPITSGGEDQ